MKYTKLGSTGLDISAIAAGAMTFGIPGVGYPEWTLDEEASRPLIKLALDAGITFFDTSNSYSLGTSEEILGRALADYADRDRIVIATKVYGRMHDGPNGQGLSRKVILTEVDHSLRRLGTDYIDLYQIHRFDSRTPLEETLEALHDVVKAGKVRYLGASSMYAWQFAKALFLQQANGWSRFVSMQPHYNLINREEEREMLPLCADQGIGVLPWSPLARGRLTRDWDEQTDRSRRDGFAQHLYSATDVADRAVADAVGSVAEARGVPRAQIALAWVSKHPAVGAPIVGFSKPYQLEDAIASLDITLTDEEITLLEAPYVPHPVVGFG
ncbi:aryl-alcohol dehydrogenase-like predicted oxidoreductase [Actinocorallia herbida]|uniref:Aryl-alcohol dehydrogenase-like predicted oxidoreductase n=1 Tax=Actinocorallia herbida TaxID=58109 RepID=A0A3N1D305_9ACTN|nr:aldo/keto reductase [Actinocorallia herbida]ROO87870.1 aryl-alcohol dehydrogenase-like predicted oxidoreductase [Actinocorallia herbida]